MKERRLAFLFVLIGIFIFTGSTVYAEEPSGNSGDNYVAPWYDSVAVEGQEDGYYYNYAPTVIRDGNTMHIYYCSNLDSEEVIDHIFYKRCRVTPDGLIVLAEEVVLYPGDGWDKADVCDPSVIKGNFTYKHKRYRLLMAYLGCSRTDCQDNKIGFAVSNDYVHWTKIDDLIIELESFNPHSNIFQWGVGQPSLTWKDGQILLFYTYGEAKGTGERVRIFQDGNFDNLCVVDEFTIANMSRDFISNADFAWSGEELYMICDKHPFSSGVLNVIADTSRVYKTTISDIQDLQNCQWELVEAVDDSVTGFLKNHNTCFVRNAWGQKRDGYIVSTAISERRFIDSLWTYRLYYIWSKN